MRAARFHTTGTPDVLAVEEVPMPTPGASQVLIKIEAAGLNFSDTIRRRGGFYPAPTPLPHISGGEAAGTIERVGEGVDASMVGKRVVATSDGAFAEYFVVPAAAAFEIPAGLDATQAVALFVQGLTAALLLKVSGVKPGNAVFVEGAAGGVGSMLVQLAKLHGAGTVIAGASTAEKRQIALDLGADAAVSYREPGWAAKVLELTGGKGVDFAFNNSGAAQFDQTFECLGRGGRIVVFGTTNGAPTLDVKRMLGKVQGVQAFILGAFMSDRALITETLAELAGFVAAGRLKISIGGTFALDQASEAHRLLENGVSTGKLIVLPR